MSAETEDGIYDLPHTNAAGAVHDVLQFLKIVWYRRNTVLLVGIICAVIAAWYAATATRYYQSSSSILIVQQVSADQGNMLGGNRSGQNLMPTHQQLLVSQPVLENAIQYIAPECLQEFKGNRES